MSQNIPTGINKLKNQLKTHVGSGDKAHLVADKQHAGFMSPEQWRRLMESLGERQWLKEGTDILKLRPGRYAGAKLVNSVLEETDPGFTFLDITWADDEHVEFREVTSYNGKAYYKNYHVNQAGANASAPSVWGEDQRVYELWGGEVSKAGTVIILNDDITKYHYIRFTMHFAEHSERMEILRSDTMALTGVNLYNSSPGMTNYEMTFTIDENDKAKLHLTNNITYADTGRLDPATEIASLYNIGGVM